MGTSYESDIVKWANEQAAMLRAGRLNQIDAAHIADEIEAVGKSEQRELARRMAQLLSYLLQVQAGHSNMSSIREQKKSIIRRMDKTPSLKNCLDDSDWLEDVWLDARTAATTETGNEFDKFPELCPWAMADVLRESWLPG